MKFHLSNTRCITATPSVSPISKLCGLLFAGVLLVGVCVKPSHATTVLPNQKCDIANAASAWQVAGCSEGCHFEYQQVQQPSGLLVWTKVSRETLALSGVTIASCMQGAAGENCCVLPKECGQVFVFTGTGDGQTPSCPSEIIDAHDSTHYYTVSGPKSDSCFIGGNCN